MYPQITVQYHLDQLDLEHHYHLDHLDNKTVITRVWYKIWQGWESAPLIMPWPSHH